ncbi:hypothetical protein KR222_004323, partial [Zaprionus bogoriensis]
FIGFEMRIILLLSALLSTCCYASYDYYRLPRSLEPQHYELRVLTHLENAEQLFFTGDVRIHLVVLARTDNITLHVGRELSVASNGTRLWSLSSKCSKCIRIIETNRNYKADFYIMRLDKFLQPGHRYVLRLQFWARLGHSMSGYYASSYLDNDCEPSVVKYISVTQFEPTDARSAFPCFDEPDMKATFNITLGHRAHYNALSNMPVIEKIPICEREHWVWSIFQQTEVMSTYLVAYSINEFEGYTSRGAPFKRSVKFTTWARSSAIEQCKYAAEIGPRIMTYYELMFNIRYPLPKMDQLAVPDFSAGAMENWGLITYREASLFYAEEDSSLTDKQHVTNIIAHELAHQWFGNLVTMKWWNDLWLNEGFATYVAILGMDRLCGHWRAYEEESVDNVLTILYTDSFCSTRPIHQSVSRGSQIAELFDSITYRKGAVIIRMMHIFIGDKAFRRGLNSYLEKHAYGNAKQEDLWQALTKAAHAIGSIPPDLDVQTVMDTWTLQPGIPLVNVQRHYPTKSATVTQRRFVMHDEATTFPLVYSEHPLESDSCWFVPISYTTDMLSNFVVLEPRVWLRCTDQHDNVPLELHDLPEDDEWIILNIQLSTPYRVNYDTANWELIIKGLQCESYRRIHVMNRAQLIDDSLALAWSGELCYTLTLELLDYLRYEHEYIPWRAALAQLLAIDRIVRETAEFDEFQHFMQHLLEPIYNSLEGMTEDADNRHHVAHKILINKWACRLGQQDCVKNALKYYQRWFISNDPDESNPVPQNLRSVVYCTAIQHGDKEDWQFIWRRYRNTTVASEQRLMLLSLGCSQDAAIIQRYLRLTFSAESLIRKQDASQIFVSIVRNDAGCHIAKDFLIHQFELLQKLQVSLLAGLLVQVANHVSSIKDYRQLKMFIASNKELLKSSRRSLRHALEQAHMNLRWRQMKLPEFTNNLAMRY